MIISIQRSFSSLADGLFDLTTGTKSSFEHFHCEIWKLFFKKKLQNISFLFDSFTNKARKLKVAESNQAKGSLTKPWLASD